MITGLTTTQDTAAPTMALALQTREAQQVQVAMLTAKRWPRDERAAIDRIKNACCRPSLAAVSQYQYAKGGTDVFGPSIRLAEAIAQQWGNIESGWRELDRHKDETGCGVSTIEAYAWDMESNYRVPRIFSVRHWRDTKGGGYAIKDERDIYEICANMAARRVRACILAVIPGDVVETAQEQCDQTLNATADTSPEAQKKIVAAFAAHGVTKAQIEARIQRRLDAITPAQVITLRKILASVKDGVSTTADWFDETKKATDPFPQAKPQAKAKPEPSPEPEPSEPLDMALDPAELESPI